MKRPDVIRDGVVIDTKKSIAQQIFLKIQHHLNHIEITMTSFLTTLGVSERNISPFCKTYKSIDELTDDFKNYVVPKGSEYVICHHNDEDEETETKQAEELVRLPSMNDVQNFIGSVTQKEGEEEVGGYQTHKDGVNVHKTSNLEEPHTRQSDYNVVHTDVFTTFKND